MIFENIEVKIIELNGEPLFEIYSTGMALGQLKVAKGKSYPRKDRIDENIKNADVTVVVHNGQQYISESQLYDLMLEMKTEKAKSFRKWVSTKVIPSIRKTGGYVQKNREEEFIQNYFPSFSEKVKLAMVQDLRNQNEQYKVQIEEQQPLVEFANQVSNVSNLIDMGCMAKLLKDENMPIGRNRLFSWLRSHNVLMNNNTPYQRYIDGGYFQVKESVNETPYGTKTFITTYVTGKGQIYITEKLRKEFLKVG